MRYLTIILSICTTSIVCQWPPTPALTPAGVPPPPWEGPIADHEIGVLPNDTPEVAKAKAYHLQAHKEVLSVLPVLPPEIRYQMTGLNVVPQQQHVVQHNVVPQQQRQHVPQHVPQVLESRIQEINNYNVPEVVDINGAVIKKWTGPLADHELGRLPDDTPEVAAAKNRHLQAAQHLYSVLPTLPVEHRNERVQSQVNQQYVPQQEGPKDTWEVEEAKKEHARRVAEILRLG